MSDRKNSARQRLIQAAIRLFLKQGITDTTTRQIAELAEVNEVTLFRNFGNKQGLLLAVIENPEIFEWLGTALSARHDAATLRGTPTEPALRSYADAYLKALAQIPDFVRSLIGEAGQSPDLRQALGRGLAQANRYTAQYLATVLPNTTRSPETIASLLNQLLLGYAVLEFTSDSHRDGANDSREAFLTHLVELFLPEGVDEANATAPSEIADLLPDRVHAILQRSKKAGLQDYALAYVLFAAGLSVDETVRLQQSHLIRSSNQPLLQVASRQVPLNQWILGQRYGSRSRNPLTQWLKSRKDDQAAMFVSATGAMSAIDLRLRWQRWIEDRGAPEGEAAAMGTRSETIEQAQQTWCVEMLTRGVSAADLSILSGRPLTELQPYARRSREKLALEKAIRLDQKPGRGD